VYAHWLQYLLLFFMDHKKIVILLHKETTDFHEMLLSLLFT